MTNRENYKRTFETLTSSGSHILEAKDIMNKNNIKNYKAKRFITGLATAAAAFGIVVAGGGAAYACDLGGVQEKFKIFINGEEYDAVQETIQLDDETTEVILDINDGDNQVNKETYIINVDEDKIMIDEENSETVIIKDADAEGDDIEYEETVIEETVEE